MLKHLPERCLPDPERHLPTSGPLGRLEGTLMLLLGTVGLSLSAALFSGWLPTDEMAAALSGRFPALFAFLTMAGVSLWWGYVLWRSKVFDDEWTKAGKEWLWGWVVAAQLLIGLAFLSLAAGTLFGVFTV